MSRSDYAMRGPGGSIRIEPHALSALVVSAVELVGGVRARRPRRGLDISVTDGKVRVELELAVRYGAVLPALARDVQAGVAAALRQSTWLEVAAVDVTVAELDR